MIGRRITPALALALCAAPLCACGSGSTNTISVANTGTAAPVASTTTTAGRSATASAPLTTTTTSEPVATATSSSSASTRTESEPAFAQTTTASGQNGPESVLSARGYSAANPSTYNAQNTLQVLIGNRDSGGGQKAFFFVNGNYIGTDSTLPSASITVVSAGDTEVTLGYGLVHPDGSSAGVDRVTFALNDGMLVPLSPIPPASPMLPVSRR